MIGKTLGQALFRRMYSNVTRQDEHRLKQALSRFGLRMASG